MQSNGGLKRVRVILNTDRGHRRSLLDLRRRKTQKGRVGNCAKGRNTDRGTSIMTIQSRPRLDLAKKDIAEHLVQCHLIIFQNC